MLATTTTNERYHARRIPLIRIPTALRACCCCCCGDRICYLLYTLCVLCVLSVRLPGTLVITNDASAWADLAMAVVPIPIDANTTHAHVQQFESRKQKRVAVGGTFTPFRYVNKPNCSSETVPIRTPETVTLENRVRKIALHFEQNALHFDKLRFRKTSVAQTIGQYNNNNTLSTT